MIAMVNHSLIVLLLLVVAMLVMMMVVVVMMMMMTFMLVVVFMLMRMPLLCQLSLLGLARSFAGGALLLQLLLCGWLQPRLVHLHFKCVIGVACVMWCSRHTQNETTISLNSMAKVRLQLAKCNSHGPITTITAAAMHCELAAA
jgi:hypothetical protein